MDKKNTKTTTAVGIGMILGSVPCTFFGVMVLWLLASLEEGRAAGRDVGFDAIGVAMMMSSTYLIALGSCLAGLLYFSLGVRSGSITLKTWHWFCLAYPLSQVTAAAIYVAAQ